MAFRPLITVRDNLGDAADRLDGTRRTAGQLRALYEALEPAWYRSRVRMYRTKGRSIGFPWPDPLSTGEAKRYIWAKRRILAVSLREARGLVLDWKGSKRRLRPALTKRGHRDAVYRVSQNRLTIGTRVPYAHKHESGRGRGPKWGGSDPIPRRRILAMGRQFRRDMDRGMRIFVDIVGDTPVSRRGLTIAALKRELRSRGVK